MREPLEQTPEEVAADARFFRWYGAWAPFGPAEVAGFMAGFPRPWWLVGGWAVEAFTGVPREHEDVDLSILACDIPALRAHVGEAWCLWSNDGGTLRPLDDRFPEVLNVESQIWVRRSAHEPWVIDLPITPDRDGLWTNKRDPGHALPIGEATWVAEDGIRYLRPEISLLYKAQLHRPKDDRDLRVTWPLLGEAEQAWLRDTVWRLYPDHPWLEVLGTQGGRGPSDRS